MPQMSPLSWSILFIYFVILLIIFSIMNYFISFNSTKMNFKKNFKINSLNWKW